MSRSAQTPPLPRDWTSTWLVLLVSAAMGFLASLGVATSVGAEALARSWTSELASRATISLTLPAAAPNEKRLAVGLALDIVRASPGVTAAAPVADSEMAKLLAPWLGKDADIAKLPLPTLIDVALEPGAVAPGAMLERRLTAAGFSAEVDAHGEWVERLEPAARKITTLAYGALLVLCAAAGLTVALACSAGLAAQSKIVNVLKLVGAEDSYISGIFVRRYLLLSVLGSGGGALLAALALAYAPSQAASAVSGAELAPILPSLRPQGLDWLRFLAIPVVFGVVAIFAARFAVMVALRKREP